MKEVDEQTAFKKFIPFFILFEPDHHYNTNCKSFVERKKE